MPRIPDIVKALVLSAILPPYALYRLLHDIFRGTSHPAWDLRTSVLCACGRLGMSFSISPDFPVEKPVDMPPPTFTPGMGKVRKFSQLMVGRGTQVIRDIAPAVSRDMIRGIASSGGDHVEPVDVPVFWIVSKSRKDAESPRASKGEKVILYCSGGGTNPTLGPIPYDLARETGLRVFALPYRSAPLPTIIVDSLSGYMMLVDRGFAPENIIIVSESAGAFASLALIRYIKELQDEGVAVGMPGAMVMTSPACNMARYEHPLVETDYRLPYYRRRLVPRLAYHFDLSTIVSNPHFNPAHAPAGSHSGFPRMFIQYGDCEIFGDDIRALVQGLQRDGVEVEIDEIYGGIHAEGTIKRSFGFKSEAWRQMIRTVKRMGWDTQAQV